VSAPCESNNRKTSDEPDVWVARELSREIFSRAARVIFVDKAVDGWWTVTTIG
jgi:hypothetical protein